MALSVVIYYTFVSLQYHRQIQQSVTLSETMNAMFMAASWMLLLFVAIFIFYANAFFTRGRKKEAALYAMFGLPKKTIGRMLFYENMIMGLAALLVGIVFGTVFSNLFSLILIKLMGSAAIIDFSVSLRAVAQTAIAFLSILLSASIQSYRLIRRFPLIELFRARKKGEEPPRASLLSAIVGVLLLAISYSIFWRPLPDDFTTAYIQKTYGFALIALMIGTRLFFRSATYYLVKFWQRNKSRHYKGLNVVETSHLLYRIRGNARAFALIALLSAATISFFVATYAGYSANERKARENAVFSYTHLSRGTDYDAEIERVIRDDPKHPVQARVEIPVIELNGELSFPLDYSLEPIKLISAGAFNEVSKALDRRQTVEVADDQAKVIQPRAASFALSDFKGEHIIFPLSDGVRRLRIDHLVSGNVLPFDYPDFFVIVSDEMFAEIAAEKKALVYIGYKVEDEKTTKETAEQLSAIIGQDFQVPSSFYFNYQQGKEGNALNLFIFGFLGLVFLAASGSVLYFKQLMEANETKPNYDILRKIGVRQRELRRSIAKQHLIVFGLPFVVGVSHSGSILYFMSRFLSSLIGINMFVPLLAGTLAFLAIYAIYYVLTVSAYDRIVNP